MVKKEEDDRNSERQNENRRIGDSEAREAGAGTLMEMKKPLGGGMNVNRVFSVYRVQDEDTKKRNRDDLREMAENETSKASKGGRKRKAELQEKRNKVDDDEEDVDKIGSRSERGGRPGQENRG
jgi:hypothetical protein